VTTGTAEQARAAVVRHVEMWNAQDKAAWLALFAEDVNYEDPPGTVACCGRQVMADYAWDRSFTESKRWIRRAHHRLWPRGRRPHPQPRLGRGTPGMERRLGTV
jgi:hypothetical protein